MLGTRRLRGIRAAALALLGAALLPDPAAAQSGAGTAGAQALQLLAGSRAAALSGAYAGAAGDADAMFYNPAGIGGLRTAAGLSYQRYVQDIAFGSASVAQRLGPLVVGAGVAYLNAGSVDEIVPDPAYGGERGERTGGTANATESAARLAVALPLGERLRVGGVAGYASTDLAGAVRAAPFFDAGVQLLLPRVALGASVRNLGGQLTGDGGAESADLPREARAGATLDLGRAGGLGAQLAADYVMDLVGSESWVVGGAELGLLPGERRPVGLVARVGYNANTAEGAQGALVLGGGLSVRALSLDYAYQSLELFGAVHRVGVRFGR